MFRHEIDFLHLTALSTQQVQSLRETTTRHLNSLFTTQPEDDSSGSSSDSEEDVPQLTSAGTCRPQTTRAAATQSCITFGRGLPPGRGGGATRPPGRSWECAECHPKYLPLLLGPEVAILKQLPRKVPHSHWGRAVAPPNWTGTPTIRGSVSWPSQEWLLTGCPVEIPLPCCQSTCNRTTPSCQE